MNALEMNQIDKSFGEVHAVNNISFVLKRGEIHGLIGENGAGKSTLMNILYGLQKQDSGTIIMNGTELNINSPLEAIENHIGMVHQHFMLVLSLTVLQNIVLGNPYKDRVLVNVKKSRKEIQKIMEKYDMEVDLDAKVYQLSVGERQRVEIIKALYRKAEILILDEPTAVLTPPETLKLIETLNQLKKSGCSIIFITHKLKEILAVADSITVMQKGIVTGHIKASVTNEEELSHLMVGHAVRTNLPRKEYHPGKEVLKLSDISAKNTRNITALNHVSFSIHQGEIIGIAGVDGNGQSELAEVISGQLMQDSGELYINEKRVTKYGIRKRREMGLSHIPEDRLAVGSAPECSIRENMILNCYYQKDFTKKGGIINKDKTEKMSEKLIEKFGVKVPDSTYQLKTLSGGNMQKVIYAREVSSEPELLIAAQPTRGVDIGAIEFMHGELLSLRDKGTGILLVSTELSEIFELSDIILVFYEGKVVGKFKAGTIDETEIGLYMSGAKKMSSQEMEAV